MSTADDVLALALEDTLGPSLILDEQLRVVSWTPAADALVGPLRKGLMAARVLCGDGDKRPVAEALAEGRAVTAEIPRPLPDGRTQILVVRASPLLREGQCRGFLLVLDEDEIEAGAPDAALERWGMSTRSPLMKKLFRDIEKVARRDVTVLVRGETGTGKELVARAIHEASPRRKGPFRAINCAALPPHLLESELFGHVRGAFTGAVRDSPGHFRLAEGGTLFLDEVAELSGDLQAKLLRVLQEKTIIPVGGRQPIPVNVRIVSATHASLRGLVAEGRFREDLMYRVRVVPLFLPPLRDRDGDVMLLSRLFLRRFSDELRDVGEIATGAQRYLENYEWPGNVRELMNVIEYSVAMGDGPVLGEADLPPEISGDEPSAPKVNVPAMTRPARNAEEERILRALERAGSHRSRAAAILGISRSTLWRKMKQLGLLDEDELRGEG